MSLFSTFKPHDCGALSQDYEPLGLAFLKCQLQFPVSDSKAPGLFPYKVLMSHSLCLIVTPTTPMLCIYQLHPHRLKLALALYSIKQSYIN